MSNNFAKKNDLLSTLSSFETRKTGSLGNIKAQEIIIEAMAVAGKGQFVFSRERFKVNVCQDRPATLTISDKFFEAKAIDYTGREQTTVKGKLIYLSGGEPWQYWFRRTLGRIVVCDFHILHHRILQIKRAAKNGAIGLVLVSGHKEHFQTGTGTPADTEGVGIPVLVIRKKDWSLIREGLAREAIICMQSVIETREGTNLIFDFPGKEHPKTIVIGAHYDSWFQGAQDNASGVAVQIAMANELVRRKLRHNIRLIFFDAEELGMIGSRHHLKNTPSDYRFFLNLDMPLPVKRSHLRVLFTSGHFKAWSQLPVNQMVSGGFLPWPLPLHAFYTRKDMCFPSDVDAFYRKRIPCATSFCSGPDYHTPADTVGPIVVDKIPTITKMFCDYVSAIDRY